MTLPLLSPAMNDGRPLTPAVNLTPFANVTPLVTPLRGSNVDQQSTASLVWHVIRLGHSHLFGMGETGEFRTLSNDNRLVGIRVVIEAAGNAATVFANATADSWKTTLANVSSIAKYGAAAAVIAPMYKDNQGIFDITGDLDLPIFLYNNPGITDGRNIEEASLRKLAGRIVGLKDSSGNSARFTRYLELGRELGFAVYQGDEKYIAPWHPMMEPSIALSGAVASMGNLNGIPQAFFDTVEKRRLLSAESVTHWQTTTNRCIDLYTCGRTNIKGGLKYLLKERGVIATTDCSDPKGVLQPAHVKFFKEALRDDEKLIWAGA